MIVLAGDGGHGQRALLAEPEVVPSIDQVAGGQPVGTTAVCRGDKFDSQTPFRDGLGAGQTHSIKSPYRVASDPRLLG